jgi:hypothetical protein
LREEGREYLIAAISQADEAYPHALAGGGAERCRGQACRSESKGRVLKRAAIDSIGHLSLAGRLRQTGEMSIDTKITAAGALRQDFESLPSMARLRRPPMKS